MKTIGQIRRERLALLKSERELTWVQMSEMLGRDRRDSTLTQIATGAPNTSSGKPRQMGDEQARELERVFGKEAGWMDRDPDFDAALEQLRRLAAAEPPARYAAWPFGPAVDPERVRALPATLRERLGQVVASALLLAETGAGVTHPPSDPPKVARITTEDDAFAYTSRLDPVGRTSESRKKKGQS